MAQSMWMQCSSCNIDKLYLMCTYFSEEIVNGCSPENTVSLSSVSFNFNTSPAIVHMLITPKAHSNNKPVSPVEHTPKMMHQQDPNLFRLQRDENANSPSASQRVRAMRAMK